MLLPMITGLLMSISSGYVCPKTEPIQVVVLVILATDQNSEVSERLKEIAAEIRKKDPQLTGFSLQTTLNKSIVLGETLHVDLGKAKAEVIINEKTDDAGRMTITVKPPKLDEITYTCTCGKFFPIITNHYTIDKQRVIIAVMAKPCKKGMMK